jgi:Tfp pilus assembly protein PilV
MRSPSRVIHGERGLSIVEVVVALTLLAIVTLGITPLLASAIRGTSVTRTRTLAKNTATEAMERIRGLPFFVSVQGQTTPTRLDVLDLFFPDRGAGFDSTSNTFTTVCTSTPPATTSREYVACPKNIPAGYTVTFASAFVSPGSGTPQTFAVEPPASDYSWSTTSTEDPPTELLRMSITVTWIYAGDAESFNLTSLIGQRTISAETMSGSGKVDYALQVLTSYRDAQGRVSRLVALAGESESDMATRAYAVAGEATTAAHIVLTRDAIGETSAETLADVSGASSLVSAPPNQYPATAGMPPGEQTVLYQHDASTQVPVAFMDDTVVEGPTPFSLGAQVVNELPLAAGKFRFSGTDTQPSFWVDPQVDRDPTAPLNLTASLKLHGTRHIVGLDQGGTRLSGYSTAQATPVSGTRKVETKASTSFDQLSIFPTTYIADGAGGTDGGAVVTIDDFTASVSCSSTANATTADATGTWSATLNYWRDPANNGLATGSGYVPVALSGSITGGTDPLADLKASNPLVYDHLVDANDLYLFKTADKNGYFTDMASVPLIAVRELNSGRVTSASLNGAIQMQTVPTSATNPSSSASISVGALACEAVDRRGL